MAQPPPPPPPPGGNGPGPGPGSNVQKVARVRAELARHVHKQTPSASPQDVLSSLTGTQGDEYNLSGLAPDVLSKSLESMLKQMSDEQKRFARLSKADQGNPLLPDIQKRLESNNTIIEEISKQITGLTDKISKETDADKKTKLVARLDSLLNFHDKAKIFDPNNPGGTRGGGGGGGGGGSGGPPGPYDAAIDDAHSLRYRSEQYRKAAANNKIGDLNFTKQDLDDTATKVRDYIINVLDDDTLSDKVKAGLLQKFGSSVNFYENTLNSKNTNSRSPEFATFLEDVAELRKNLELLKHSEKTGTPLPAGIDRAGVEASYRKLRGDAATVLTSGMNEEEMAKAISGSTGVLTAAKKEFEPEPPKHSQSYTDSDAEIRDLREKLTIFQNAKKQGTLASLGFDENYLKSKQTDIQSLMSNVGSMGMSQSEAARIVTSARATDSALEREFNPSSGGKKQGTADFEAMMALVKKARHDTTLIRSGREVGIDPGITKQDLDQQKADIQAAIVAAYAPTSTMTEDERSRALSTATNMVRQIENTFGKQEKANNQVLNTMLTIAGAFQISSLASRAIFTDPMQYQYRPAMAMVGSTGAVGQVLGNAHVAQKEYENSINQPMFMGGMALAGLGMSNGLQGMNAARGARAAGTPVSGRFGGFGGGNAALMGAGTVLGAVGALGWGDDIFNGFNDEKKKKAFNASIAQSLFDPSSLAERSNTFRSAQVAVGFDELSKLGGTTGGFLINEKSDNAQGAKTETGNVITDRLAQHARKNGLFTAQQLGINSDESAQLMGQIGSTMRTSGTTQLNNITATAQNFGSAFGVDSMQYVNSLSTLQRMGVGEKDLEKTNATMAMAVSDDGKLDQFAINVLQPALLNVASSIGMRNIATSGKEIATNVSRLHSTMKEHFEGTPLGEAIKNNPGLMAESLSGMQNSIVNMTKSESGVMTLMNYGLSHEEMASMQMHSIFDDKNIGSMNKVFAGLGREVGGLDKGDFDDKGMLKNLQAIKRIEALGFDPKALSPLLKLYSDKGGVLDQKDPEVKKAIAEYQRQMNSNNKAITSDQLQNQARGIATQYDELKKAQQALTTEMTKLQEQVLELVRSGALTKAARAGIDVLMEQIRKAFNLETPATQAPGYQAPASARSTESTKGQSVDFPVRFIENKINDLNTSGKTHFANTEQNGNIVDNLSSILMTRDQDRQIDPVDRAKSLSETFKEFDKPRSQARIGFSALQNLDMTKPGSQNAAVNYASGLSKAYKDSGETGMSTMLDTLITNLRSDNKEVVANAYKNFKDLFGQILPGMANSNKSYSPVEYTNPQESKPGFQGPAVPPKDTPAPAVVPSPTTSIPGRPNVTGSGGVPSIAPSTTPTIGPKPVFPVPPVIPGAKPLPGTTPTIPPAVPGARPTSSALPIPTNVQGPPKPAEVPATNRNTIGPSQTSSLSDDTTRATVVNSGGPEMSGSVPNGGVQGDANRAVITIEVNSPGSIADMQQQAYDVTRRVLQQQRFTS